MAFGKLGAMGRGFGSLGALGRSGIPPFQAAAAFGPMKTKLNNAQNVVIFVNGDSTAYAAQGPYQLFLQQLAQAYAGTARLFFWREFADATKDYAAAVDTVYGAGPVVTMYLAAMPGQVAGCFWDASRKPTAIDAIPTPDVCIVHQGHNMDAFDTQTNAGLMTGVGLLHSSIGMTSLKWPGAPQIMTTQNPDRLDLAMSNQYLAYLAAGLAIPSVSLIDTYADFIALGKPVNLYRPVASDGPGIHPSDATGDANFAGATMEANRLMAAFNLATAGAFTTTNWPANAGTQLLANGDFSNWTGALPVQCVAVGGGTAVKDTIIKYGGATYSMAISAVGINDGVQYNVPTADVNAMKAAGTVSVAFLYYSPSTLPRPFFSFQTKDAAGTTHAWVQGDFINAQDNWYLACISGIQVGTLASNINTVIKMLPMFKSGGPFSGALRVQKIMVVAGNLPSGPLP